MVRNLMLIIQNLFNTTFKYKIMASEKNTASQTQTKPVSIRRTFDLPLNALWKAFSDEESLQKWWGPENFTCPYCTIDFVEGGKFLASMKGPDGNEVFSTGTYKEIIPHERIEMTDSFSDKKGNIIPASDIGMPGEWPLECYVTLEFEEKNDKTELSLIHEGIPPEMHDDCVSGWQQCLDKLEREMKD